MFVMFDSSMIETTPSASNEQPLPPNNPSPATSASTATGGAVMHSMTQPTATAVYSTGYPNQGYAQPSQMLPPSYPQPHPQQQQQQQQMSSDLGCYVYNMAQTEDAGYLDINSLEPTLWSPPTQSVPPASYYYGQPQQQIIHQHLMPPPQHHNSPTASSHTSSTGSDESDDMFNWHPYKRSPPGHPGQQPSNMFDSSGPGALDVMASRLSATSTNSTTSTPANTQKRANAKQTKKRKPKKDPNEPTKPVSAYALFFRDTQAAIKGQNPNASFGEVSKIVASMWDNLDTDSKNAYKQKTETEKKEYLKKLAAYRANLLSKNGGSANDSALAAHQDFLNATAGVSGGGRMYAGAPGTSTAGAHKLGANGPGAKSKSNGHSPDSTTAGGSQSAHRSNDSKSSDNLPKMGDYGGRTLASLIAEPAPQQVLTATTTLTVPQNYIPMRSRGEYDDVPSSDQMHPGYTANTSAAGANFGQQREFLPNEALVHHCRDVFNIWGQSTHQTQSVTTSNGHATGFTPV